MITTEAVMKAVESVRQDEFARRLEEHQRIIFKVANTYCRLAEDRADLAQEIAAQLWRAFPSYDSSRSFSTWMYRIALNVAISHFRAARYREAHTVALDVRLHEPAQPAVADGDARVRELHRVIETLDPLSRALLLLYLDEHTYREIASILGITETNVATRISRLKRRIREDIERK
jgi:RNA polymerase sigma factor (sigma-70 family)